MKKSILNAAAWEVECERMAGRASASCGMSYDLFVYHYSCAVQRAIHGLASGDRQMALCIAGELGYEDRDVQDDMAERRSRLYRLVTEETCCVCTPGDGHA